MLLANTQKLAAKQFVKNWTGRGYEKGETQRFWLELLHNVFGIDNPMAMMEFEVPVKTIYKEKGADFIDAYITSTKVLIEQKGSKVDLSAKARQSDGMELTPYQQARRYAAGLPLSMAPRWIVACNFETFEVHDMERPTAEPEVIRLEDLEKEYHRLSFLVDDSSVHLKKELEVSIQAGEIVGVLYEKLLAQYRNPDDPESQKALNKLCVRLVFCLYAEDAGIFGSKNMFHDYMDQFSVADFREKLIKLFRILDQKPEYRDPYEDEKLLAFPYVNGGMFAGDIEIPRINDEIRTLILQRASDDFDWSMISPTIFGAVFESTLNPETRRAGGMHYTSIENIHKVIDPLFLDDLKAELADIKSIGIAKTRRDRAYAFQDKLAGLKFFDPACGSGNFLTESYTSLRRLENETLRIIYGGDRVLGELNNPIKVSINQFYGIEINDFACSVAQTALWIAESQMMQETDEIVGLTLDPLPLKTYTNIHEGNALRMDWNEVIPAVELNYIMGNPPFIGYAVQTPSQKEDMRNIFTDKDGKTFPFAGKIDYVAAWYRKGVEYMKDNTRIHGAFVSTNSVTQGEQVAFIWKDLVETHGLRFDFAYRTFQWDSEATLKAHVYCVIIGFSLDKYSNKPRYIFDKEKSKVSNINAYLYDAPDVYVESRTKALCPIPTMVYGNKPVEGGFLILSEEERADFIDKYPFIEPYIHLFLGAEEFIYNKKRYCFWLVNANPGDIRRCPPLVERIEQVRSMRLASKKEATRRIADTPTLFAEIRQPAEHYMAIPEVSGERRKYVPIGFMGPEIICSNKIQLVPLASKYDFGVVTSIVNMAWLRVVCGRLGMSYDYSAKIVYNNLPWPNPSEEQIKKIEATAQMILDARSLYPENSFADIYDDLAMPVELRKAHRANDAAVLEAYGFPKDASESEIVARLFKMYQDLTK